MFSFAALIDTGPARNFSILVHPLSAAQNYHNALSFFQNVIITCFYMIIDALLPQDISGTFEFSWLFRYGEHVTNMMRKRLNYTLPSD